MAKKKSVPKKSCKKSCSKKSCEAKSRSKKKCAETSPEIKETVMEVKKNTKAGEFLRMIKKALGYE